MGPEIQDEGETSDIPGLPLGLQNKGKHAARTDCLLQNKSMHAARGLCLFNAKQRLAYSQHILDI